MNSKKKLIWLISALEQIVAKLREDVNTLKRHKTTNIAESTKNKNTTPKLRESLRDIIFNSVVVPYVIMRIIIKVVRVIIEGLPT